MSELSINLRYSGGWFTYSFLQLAVGNTDNYRDILEWINYKNKCILKTDIERKKQVNDKYAIISLKNFKT